MNRLLTELERWRRLGGELSRDDVAGALERLTLRPLRGDEAGRVAVVDLLRARTRRFDIVFVLGLEEGSLPRRGSPSPFLDEDARRALDERGARVQRPDTVSRDRYLFYTACTRPLERVYLVREAATDDGSPREPSPFWEEVQAVFDPEDVRRWTGGGRSRRSRGRSTTRPPSASACARSRSSRRTTAPAPTRSRARTAGSGGSSAHAARFRRPTKLTHPHVLEQLGSKTTFNVTELERFADCSSAWFVERFLDPRSIDAEVDAKLRGSVAHAALYRFFTRVPKESVRRSCSRATRRRGGD